jgi:hypothetical protein
MTTFQTEDLKEGALDWAAAIAYGLELSDENLPVWFDDHGAHDVFHPSRRWSQGGPIIECARIELIVTPLSERERWKACITPNPRSPHYAFWRYGPTPLVAAMRCYVAARLGDTVDIPEGLP